MKRREPAFSGMKPFRRLLVLGCGGAGKSTLAVRLGEITGLPVVHLDRIYWRSGWQHLPADEFDAALSDRLAEDSWIIDGDYNRTLPVRLKRCDAVVLLDYPAVLCAAGVVKRRIMYRGRTRFSMAEGCPERLDGEFLRWILSYRRKIRPAHLELLRQAAAQNNHLQLFILRNRRQTRRWLQAAADKFGADRSA